MMQPRLLVAITALLLYPSIASAHSLGARLGDFYEGFLHPPLTLDHVFPILALGLLAGQQGKKSGRLLLVLLPLAMLGGGVVAMHYPELAWVGAINIFSFILLGLLVALQVKLSPWLLAIIGLLFGLSHGYTNGLEVSIETDPLLFFSGVGSASLFLVAYGSAVAIRLLAGRQQWPPIAIRVAGSWIAAMGILIAAFTAG